MATKNKALLIILDGWGLSSSEIGNAPFEAKTPVLDYIYSTYPKTSISAAGLEVGLNPGEPGNSEVGHLNLGSGRVVWEDLPRINQAIENGEFYKNEIFLQAMEQAKKNDSTLHLWGLVSDGGVHSHIKHMIALIEMAKKEGVKNLLVHFVADGRDTEAEKAKDYVKELEGAFKKFGIGRIATIVGRYYAMDRDKNWDRVKPAYQLIMENSGKKFENIEAAIDESYKNKQGDEYINPSVIGEGGVIAENDAVIMTNYRSDRARQMYDLLSIGGNDPFARQNPRNVLLVTMTKYRKSQAAPEVFSEVGLVETLAQALYEKDLKQYHIAETEKYAHVTYFFNGGIERPYPKEDQVLVPSKKVKSYAEVPEMSAKEVAEKLVGALDKEYQFVLVNFANGDMVGHTGNHEAAVSACQTVDQLLLPVLETASKKGYRVILTADHGNCESMIDEKTKKPNKEHTTNPVPLVHLDFEKIPFAYSDIELPKEEYIKYASSTPVGILADVAPSILAIMGLKKPEQMGGMDLTVAL